MIKRILGIILIIIIILIGIGYCSGKKSSEKNESKIDLAQVNSELNAINNNLTSYGNNILSVWENTTNNGTITKKNMAMITNAPYDQFVTYTKESQEENYTDGLSAAKVESSYYNNVGIFPDIKEQLNKIKTLLDDVDNKNTTDYNNAVKRYNNAEGLISLLSNPSGDFFTYRNNVYEKEQN